MQKYYRRVKRDGDRLRSTYIGCVSDPLVHLMKRRDRLSKAERDAQLRQHKAEKVCRTKLDFLLNTTATQLPAALRVWLRTQSMTIARDGTWQTKTLRRSKKETTPMKMSRDDFEELLTLAETGNETALSSLRKIMKADRETWFPFGDLKTHARKLMIDSLTRGNTVARESLHINLHEMRDDLRGDHENCVRDHAIDHVLTCWVDMHRQTMMATEPSPSRSAADFNDRRLASAQKRFQSALKFLNDLNVQLGIKPVAAVTSPETADATDAGKQTTEHAANQQTNSSKDAADTEAVISHIRSLVKELDINHL